MQGYWYKTLTFPDSTYKTPMGYSRPQGEDREVQAAGVRLHHLEPPAVGASDKCSGRVANEVDG